MKYSVADIAGKKTNRAVYWCRGEARLTRHRVTQQAVTCVYCERATQLFQVAAEYSTIDDPARPDREIILLPPALRRPRVELVPDTEQYEPHITGGDGHPSLNVEERNPGLAGCTI